MPSNPATMRLYRIYNERRSPDDSQGAKLLGGRWNPKGYGVLYSSAHLSLACLEKLVHLGPHANPGKMRYAFTDIALVHDSLDPRKEFVHQGEQCTAEIGKQWIVHGKSLAVRVPSVLIPEEDNVLLNPFHEDYASLQWDSKPFDWDQRLLELVGRVLAEG